MDSRKRIQVAVLFLIVTNAAAGKISPENDRGYISKGTDDNFYADYNAIVDDEVDKKMIPVWLEYLNRMPKTPTSDYHEFNAYQGEMPVDQQETSTMEQSYRDPTADAQEVIEIGEFKRSPDISFRGRNRQEQSNFVPWKRFGDGSGVFERFRTTLYGGRPMKQDLVKSSPQNNPGNQMPHDSAGNENNNVNNDLFWKEKLLPQGIFHSLART